MTGADLVFRRVEVDGRLADVVVRAGEVVRLTAPGSAVGTGIEIDGRGGALLPGLHDHHLHVFAAAAALQSMNCEALRNEAELAAALRAATGRWVRAVGYHERIAGPLDRGVLDRLAGSRPVRVQHRSGALWMLNSRALEAIADVLDDSADVERDYDGHPTGRLWRYDSRLRHALPPEPPELDALADMLLAYGITGVTDATPGLTADGLDLPQRVTALGTRKLHLRDHDLPDLAELTDLIARKHAAGDAVAVHCVTPDSLALSLAAFEDAGVLPGDRIEHAAVVLPSQLEQLARLDVTVVTQPGFVRTRGDDYLRDVEPFEQPFLYRYRSLLDAGIRVAPSSDAPYGPLDPWQVIATAADRHTAGSAVLGPDEQVPMATALAGYLSPADDPGGLPRRVEPGARADLCLLDAPLAEALTRAPANPVRMTVVGGRVLWRRRSAELDESRVDHRPGPRARDE